MEVLYLAQEIQAFAYAPGEYTNANFQKMRDKMQEHFDSEI